MTKSISSSTRPSSAGSAKARAAMAGALTAARRRLARCALLLLLTALAGGLASQAQTPPSRSSLRGRVLDSTGAAIAGARIIVSTQDTGAPVLTGSTDRGGEFSLALDPASHYRLRIVADGFEQLTENLTLPPAGSDFREFVLRVAGPHGAVTVTAPEDCRVEAISSATGTHA